MSATVRIVLAKIYYIFYNSWQGWISGRAAMACEKLKDEEILEDIREHIFKEIVNKG